MMIDRERVAAALPGYAVGEQLGKGAFGLVLSAEHRRMGRPVAVKVMDADGAEGLVPVDFAAEARVLAGLDHPHVVRAYDYLETDGLCLVVMELLAGGTLTRRRRTDIVDSVVFSPDGHTLASSSYDTTVRLWSAG